MISIFLAITFFLKGRIADLEIQHEKGEITDEEIFQEELSVAKYWARDQITNQLKVAAQSTPKVQGNSIFALVALSNAVASLEDEENVSTEKNYQYVSMRHWLLKVADTLIVVFDGNAKISGKPFQWCQQVNKRVKSTRWSVKVITEMPYKEKECFIILPSLRSDLP